MSELISKEHDILMKVDEIGQSFMENPLQFPFYTVIYLTEGSGTYFVDIGQFEFSGPVLLFSTPLQKLVISQTRKLKGYTLQFHSDFYCIEYHKAQVACNGLLFNNIYIQPSLSLNPEQSDFFKKIFVDIQTEFVTSIPDEFILQSYLRLFLAKSSSIKLQAIANPGRDLVKDGQMEIFSNLLESNYLTLHKPINYAELLSMSPNTLTKKCQRYYGKTPSLMIQERLVLEAKKKLHLTRQSIKEIAFALNFSDEFYFSRFFKKFTNVSPQGYRDRAGISVVADLKS